MNPHKDTLPLLGKAALWFFLDEDDYYQAIGDFEEVYRERVKTKGSAIANLWFWFMFFKSLPGLISNSIYWSAVMIKNYLKVALRNIKRHKGYSFINITGLALGMACSLLTFLYVQYELSYDKFHKKADRIYRVAVRSSSGESSIPTQGALAKTLREECPGIETATGIVQINPIMMYKDKAFQETKTLAVDKNFFNVFSFPLLEGAPQPVLSQPNMAVLTYSTAKKYFGDEDPINKIFTIKRYYGDYEFKVTAVIEDVPDNSHFHFDVLLSLETFYSRYLNDWRSRFFKTYIVIKENYPLSQMSETMTGILHDYVYPQKLEPSSEYLLQPLTDIHLHSHFIGEFEPNGDITYVSIFSIVGLLVLIISCINFINLTTARSAQRSREVGMRKVIGSRKSQLIKQFLGESALFSLIAMCLALTLVKLFLPVLRNLTNSKISLNYFDNLVVLPALISIALIIGFLAGIYPAFVLSSFQPVMVLKSLFSSRIRKRSIYLRNGLVAFQFFISISLIICMLVIFGQLAYLQNMNLGFTKEPVVVIQNLGLSGSQHNVLKNELSEHSSISCVTFSSSLPGQSASDRSNIKMEGIRDSGIEQKLYFLLCDSDFLKTLEMEMLEGRFFSQEFQTDTNSIIINEETVRYFGLEDPLGKSIWYQNKRYQTIGVIKDFHYQSLHKEIVPLGLKLFESYDEFPPRRFIEVRIKNNHIPETLDLIRKTWTSVSKGMPFVYSFLDESLDQWYKNEQKMSRIITIFCSLAIFISCLGLFGLATLSTEKRTKEIGIRKILGGSISQITFMLYKDTIRLVILAAFLSWPIAYFVMKNWLKNFAYRIDISIWTFLFSAAFALFIALLTVSFQTVKAATANPVDSLRYE